MMWSPWAHGSVEPIGPSSRGQPERNATLVFQMRHLVVFNKKSGCKLLQICVQPKTAWQFLSSS